MSTCIVPRHRIVILAILTAALPAWAQTPRPATGPATALGDPEVQKRARAVIDAALEKYRGAKSYQDKVTLHSERIAQDRNQEDLSQIEDFMATLRFAAPNRVALRTDDYAVHSDGKRYWNSVPMLEQYTETEAPARLSHEDLVRSMPAQPFPHPILYVLLERDRKFDELFPDVQGFTAVEREQRDGRAGTRIRGLTRGIFGPEAVVPFSLWFDEQTGLLGEVRLELLDVLKQALGLTEDATEEEKALSDQPGMPKTISRAFMTLSLADVKLDAEIPTDQFTFVPASTDKKVDRFSDPSEMPGTEQLVGRTGPPLEGTGLDGQPVKLEALRDKVVLLDFWATWCVPCVQAMPGLQKLSEQYKDKPVVVIGVNQDSKSQDKKVRQFLEDKKITFRQVLDPEGKSGRAYKVVGLPTTVLLDKQGVIQAVHIGSSPTLHEELARQIDRLLKGESLIEADRKAPARTEPPAGTPAGEKRG